MSNKEERDRARRQAIIEAALSCFLQFGYAKTSLEDIARRAKLSRPLLYQKFANKEAIFAAAYESMFEGLYPRAHAVLAEGCSRKDQLARVCEIVVLEPWTLLQKAPMAEEFYRACETLAPEIAAKHAKKWLAIVQRILADRLSAEVFTLALEGVYSDLPTVAVLRKRIAVLVERFAS